MNPLNLDEVCVYVNENIDQFHKRRIEIIKNLTLSQLTSKNPYLFRAKNVTKASELIEGTLDAFLSSSEEKLFGDFLENLAIFVANKTTGGHKSSAAGIDLEYENEGVYHIISIKSGPNWGNASQYGKLALDFADAERRLRQSHHSLRVEKVLGICYGKTKTVLTRHGYIKMMGQNFWAYISGNQDLFIQIVEPLGFHAREHNDHYFTERGRITNSLTGFFIEKYCDKVGNIDWERLIQANSGNYDLDKFF